MAHYDIFRDQLGLKYPAYGHALWEPSPGRLYSGVEVGDVGFIREGQFRRLFNALLPGDHPSHRNFGVPSSYEPLTTPGVAEHIDSLILNSHDFCSGGVMKTTESEVFAAAPPDPGQLSFSCTTKQGAVLCLPVQAQREDTIARGAFRDYILKHIRNWFDFARDLGLGIDHMGDIILVTGRDRARSCTNVAFPGTEGQAEARVSFGVNVLAHVGIQWNFSHENILGAVLNRGRSGRDLPEDQCIFIRGWRVTRTLIILRKLRGAAGPSDLGGSDPESGVQAMFVPAVPKYRDPLHGLLEYLGEQTPESDMVLVHDDDLEFIKDTSLETLEADVVKSHLRHLKPAVQQVVYDSTSSDSDESGLHTDRTVIRVAMLSRSNKLRGNVISYPTPLVSASQTAAPHTPDANVMGAPSTTPAPLQRPKVRGPISLPFAGTQRGRQCTNRAEEQVLQPNLPCDLCESPAPPEEYARLGGFCSERHRWEGSGSSRRNHGFLSSASAGEGPSGVLDPSEINVSLVGNQPALPPYSAQVEEPMVQEDEDPEHDPPGSVGLPPVRDQAVELGARADPGTPQFPCPVCGRIFSRAQERNRHFRAFLPDWIHCPLSSCGFRCDRPDNLANHWVERHADVGPAPQRHQRPQYQIYDPDPLVTQIASGLMSMESAENIALLEVEKRAQELGKGNVWGRDWWGRRRRPH